MRVIDVKHLGRPHVIGCFEIDGVLVDPGPESCLESLLEGLGEGFEPKAVFLTHIHFDHAGASGALVKRFPSLPVYMHERGARHMIDPERLVSSATRLYGEDGMKHLWGEVVPVPEANVHVLQGGETHVEGAFTVAYTPGHASHHVAYLHEDTGFALCGDVAGVRVEGHDFVLAPTPPPDIDLEAWEASLELIGGWRPNGLGITHFGRVDDVVGHLDRLRTALREQAELAERLDVEGFERAMAERVPAAERDAYLQAAPPEHQWLGMKRYRDKKAS